MYLYVSLDESRLHNLVSPVYVCICMHALMCILSNFNLQIPAETKNTAQYMHVNVSGFIHQYMYSIIFVCIQYVSKLYLYAWYVSECAFIAVQAPSPPASVAACAAVRAGRLPNPSTRLARWGV